MLVNESLDSYIYEMKGGKGEHTNSDDVNADELTVGVATEMEHTDDASIAKDIAMDHLTEDPKYYTKLIKAGLVDEPEALRLYRKLLK
jgi:hypothetical protein